MPDRTRLRWPLGLVLALAGGCERGAQPPAPPEALTLQLKWRHQAQFAGVYLAQDAGLFGAAGLAVTVLPGGPAVVPLQSLTDGRAELALVAAEDLIVARRAGAPVLAVAAIFRRSPLVFMSPRERPLRHPRDLIGARVAFAGVDGRVQLDALLRRHSIAATAVTPVPFEPDYAGLLAGRTDVASGYATSGLLRLAAQGHAMATLWPEDFGVRFYGDVLATTDAALAAHPGRIARAVQALMKGWQRALEQPERALEATLVRSGRDEAELQRKMLARTLSMLRHGPEPIGSMSAAEWAAMAGLLSAAGVIDRPGDATDYFSPRALDDAAQAAR